MGFRKDLDAGKTGESLARKKIESFGISTKDGDGKKVDFYIVLYDVEYSCECKYDIYANRSGNLAFETYNTKKCQPSGIELTTCHLWIHVLSEAEIYINTVAFIKDIISKNKPNKEVNNAGDQNAFIKLYNKDRFIDINGVYPISEEIIKESCKQQSS
jgi:predicted metal-binding transcription factor (methanogenesis marker protein 9)